MKSLCLRKVNSDATGYVQPIQSTQNNLYTNCYREIRKYRRHISFFITPIILSLLIACGAGGGGGGNTATGAGGGAGDATTDDNNPSTALASPGGVTVTPLSSTSMRVSWNSVSDVKFYRLYDNRGGAVINITPPATSYNARDLLPNTGYTYRVAACNESGCSVFTKGSAATLPASVTPPNPVTIPAIPASPSSIRAGSLSLTATSITWDRVDAAEYYEVHNNDKRVTTINHPATTSYTVTNLSPNTVYTYSVKACNDFGCSDSIEVTFVTTSIGVSSAPQVSVVTSTIGQSMPSLNVSWGRIREVTSYQIFDAAGNNIVNVSSPNTSHIIADLSADTLYEYKVRGCYESSVPASSPGSSEVCGDFSEVGSATTPPIAIPAIPNNVAAISQTLTSISISWDRVDGADNYEVHNSDGLVATIDHPATSYIATNLLPATEYTYEVKACNTSGCSDFVSVSAITGVVSISNAADLAAIRTNDATLSGNYTLTGNIDLSQIPNWQPIGNGTNKFTGSFDGNGYNISGVSSSGYQYAGLFGYVEDANISNVGVLVGNISSSSSSRSDSYSGGLVGNADGSQISNSYAVVGGGISSLSSSSSHSDSYSGGLVGYASSSDISNSYAVVEGNISSSSSSSYSGGLVGRADDNSLISNSYYSASRESSEGGFSNTLGTSQTLAELRALDATATTWDEGIWDFGTDANLPILRSLPSPAVTPSPASPGDFTATASGLSAISMSWGSVDGAVSYEVHNSSGLVTTIGHPATTYIATGLLPNKEYTYSVRACYLFSCSGFVSASAMILVAIPATPSNVAATSLGFTSIRISWDRVEGADNYEVHNSDGLVATIDHPATSYIATGLLPNTGYTYRVAACNDSGCSASASATATTENAIIINNAAELAAIRTNDATLAGNYTLTGNIDLSHIPNWRPIGNSVNKFTGIFDGNGYNISGVSSSGYQYAGLFGYVQNANISNVGVLVGNISSSGGNSYSGGLVGFASFSEISNSYAVVGEGISSSLSSGGLVGRADSSPISNSYAVVGGDISSSSRSDSYSGGLVGYASNNSPISNSYAVVGGSISSSSSSSSSSHSDSYSGGLVGDAYYSQISNSYALVGGSISSSSSGGNSYSGGLVGYASNSPISNSYALVGGNISSSSFVSSYSGGMVGNTYNSRISNSYYKASRKSSEGGFDNSHGTSETLSGLRELNAGTTGWDASIWDFGTDANPPTLRSLPSPTVTRYLASPEVTVMASGLTAISISWGSVAGAASYEVHNSSGLVTSIGYPTTSYGAIDLLPNTEYTYKVRACYLFSCSDFTSASAITMIVEISSAAELAAISTNRATLAGDYNLTGNIDLSDIPNWQPIGNEANKFTGSFDGNGYNISGVSSSGYQYAGLFGYVENANISNVGVLVGNISSYRSSYSGGLVGRASNSEINNSYALVEVSILSFSEVHSHSGGLVGYADNSPISNSYAVVGGSISSFSATRRIIDSSYSGGLVGYADNSPISNSYAVVGGSISSDSSLLFSANSNSGGLVGYAYGSPISNSYAVVGGSISSSAAAPLSSYNSYSANSYSGGLVGSADESPISNSYAVVGGSISSSTSTSSSSHSDSYSGGLVGSSSDSPISNSYAVVGGGISSLSSSSSHSDSYSGGLVGRIVGNSPISKSYYSASRESSEGEFTNSHGTSETLSGLRELNAGTTRWSAGIWDFGSDNDLPMLVGNPITVDLPLVFRE